MSDELPAVYSQINGAAVGRTNAPTARRPISLTDERLRLMVPI
jgi:hypothetical protein